MIYSARRYELDSLKKAFNHSSHQLLFNEIHLDKHSAKLAEGCDAAAIFVNDKADRETLKTLADVGVSTLLLRCAGYNNVDVETAKQLGFYVYRVPAYSPHAVAEHACALILSLNRHIHKAYNRVRDSNFSIEGLVGFDLFNKTVGVIGTGAIGNTFCRIMQGFGCRVIAFDPTPDNTLAALGVEYLPLSQLLSKADIISLHCPLTPETHHLINRETLALIQHHAIVINTSRGGLIDTHAVIDALKDRHLGGLAIDVYEEEGDYFFEDLSGSVIGDDDLMRLTTFPNVLVTGHQAFLTHEALHNIAHTTKLNADAAIQKVINVNSVI